MKNIVYFALAVLLLAACSAPAANPDDPQAPEIMYGQEVCEQCGMLIDAPAHAAATITLKGEAHKFEDIGDMLIFHMEHPEEQVKAWFVHDFKTEKWLRGEKAFFVMDPAKFEPMGHSIVAFANEGDAQAYATETGASVYSLDEARVNVHMIVHQ